MSAQVVLVILVIVLPPVSIIVLVIFVEPERSQSSPCGEEEGLLGLGLVWCRWQQHDLYFSFILDKVDVFLHRQAVVGSGDEVYSNIVNAQV